MGGQYSAMRTEEDFLKDFEEIRRESDINFGSVIIFRNKRNPKLTILVKEKHILAEDELATFLDQTRLRTHMKGNNIAPLIEVFVHSDKKLCSTSYKAMIGFEFHERTLEKLLRQRKTYDNEEAQSLAEVDAWGILNDLIAALKVYKEKELVHGDIQPANIFVLNDKTLKLIDTCFMCDYATAFERRYQDCAYKSPLSPQALRAVTLGPKYATFNREKNDIWALGITLLVSLTNEDFNIFYDWHSQEVNYELILKRLRRVQAMRYSSDFLKVLTFMLEKEESRRANFFNLQDFIKRAKKPVYASELQDLQDIDLSQEEEQIHQFKPNQIKQRITAQAPIPQNLTAIQTNLAMNTDVYGNPLALEGSYIPNQSQYYEPSRQTAPIMMQNPYSARGQQGSPRDLLRERSPLNYRFGKSNQQQMQMPANPQFNPVLRDIGNFSGAWTENNQQGQNTQSYASQKATAQMPSKSVKRQLLSNRQMSPAHQIINKENAYGQPQHQQTFKPQQNYQMPVWQRSFTYGNN
jgi:serine/threonine protein kinase